MICKRNYVCHFFEVLEPRRGDRNASGPLSARARVVLDANQRKTFG